MRPHIEFIQAQLIPWRRIGQGSARPDAEYKFLSRDEDTGACSALIRYPPGWQREGDNRIVADEEFYVLTRNLFLVVRIKNMMNFLQYLSSFYGIGLVLI